MKLLTIYYDLYDILGEVETVACAIKEITNSKDSMSMINQNLNFLRLWHYEDELNFLYDMKMDELRAYKEDVICRQIKKEYEDKIKNIKQKQDKYQADIYDFTRRC